MSTRFWSFTVLTVALLAFATWAGGAVDAETASQLSGTWKRLPPSAGGGENGGNPYDGPPPEDPNPQTRYYLFEDDGTGITGRLLETSLGTIKSYEITLSRIADDRLEGTARWQDSYKEDGKTYRFSAESKWELQIVDENLIRGRVEYVDWELPADPADQPFEIGRGWQSFEFKRLPRLD